jgi:NAD-reducing hydrogenase large subunit
LAKERIHPSWIVPGGVNAPLDPAIRDRFLADLPEAKAITLRTLAFFKGVVDQFKEEIDNFGNMQSMHVGLVDETGGLQMYDGGLRFIDTEGKIIVDHMPASDYGKYIGEASVPYSFLKAPYFKPLGFPDGLYRVGPLARLNVASHCGTPIADVEFKEYHQRFGKIVHSSFHFHYARMIEIIYCLEKMEMLLADPQILSKHVRAQAGVNCLEGIGVAEAPRGTLVHHYKVNEEGAIVWANLIIATGHNNLAIGKSVEQVAKHFVQGKKMKEGMLNRVSAVVRAYDPCLSCSTHADGQYPLEINLVDTDGSVVDTLRS